MWRADAGVDDDDVGAEFEEAVGHPLIFRTFGVEGSDECDRWSVVCHRLGLRCFIAWDAAFILIDVLKRVKISTALVVLAS